MQKMRFFRRCLPLFLAFWLLLAVAGAPFAAYAGESVTVRDSSGQVRYAAPMDPENACPALQSALDTVRSGKNKGKIALQWKAVPGAKQYVLYRRDGSIRGRYRRVVTLTGTRYIDTAPKRGKTAAYRLVAQTKTNGVTAESPVARAAVRIKG